MTDAFFIKPVCQHDCAECIGIFEAAQVQSEQRRVELLHEQQEHALLWREVREAMARTLYDLAPLRRAGGTPGTSEEFARGWNLCVAEIELRIRELQKVF